MAVVVVGADKAALGGSRSNSNELGGVLGVNDENDPDEAKVKLEASELSILGVGRLGEERRLDSLSEKGRRGCMLGAHNLGGEPGISRRKKEVKDVVRKRRAEDRRTGRDRYTTPGSQGHLPKQAKETSPESDPRKSAILLDSSTWDFPHCSYISSSPTRSKIALFLSRGTEKTLYFFFSFLLNFIFFFTFRGFLRVSGGSDGGV